MTDFLCSGSAICPDASSIQTACGGAEKSSALPLNQIICGNCLQLMKSFPENSIDLIVTDPPYGISFMGKDWDTFNEVVDPQGAYAKIKGFHKLPRNKPIAMHEFFVPIWKECLRILKPGAFAFVMCSTRQDVLCKQISALQEAGFETGLTSIYWTYSTGFPKAINIAKAAMKKPGDKGEVVGRGKIDVGIQSGSMHANRKSCIVERDIVEPTNPEAIELKGAYTFQPKPAVEIILVVMKPLSEKTYLEQALENRKGAVWFDECKIPYQKNEEVVPFQYKKSPDGYGYQDRNDYRETDPEGRFPTNLLVSDDVLNSNSRYFSLDAWWDTKIKELPEGVQKVFPFLIVPKPSTSEKENGTKNHHPTVKPVKLMSYLIALGSRQSDVVLDPFLGSGTAAVAARLLNRRFIGIEISEEYCEIARKRLAAIPEKLESFAEVVT